MTDETKPRRRRDRPKSVVVSVRFKTLADRRRLHRCATRAGFKTAARFLSVLGSHIEAQTRGAAFDVNDVKFVQPEVLDG